MKAACEFIIQHCEKAIEPKPQVEILDSMKISPMIQENSSFKNVEKEEKKEPGAESKEMEKELENIKKESQEKNQFESTVKKKVEGGVIIDCTSITFGKIDKRMAKAIIKAMTYDSEQEGFRIHSKGKGLICIK